MTDTEQADHQKNCQELHDREIQQLEQKRRALYKEAQEQLELEHTELQQKLAEVKAAIKKANSN